MALLPDKHPIKHIENIDTTTLPSVDLTMAIPMPSTGQDPRWVWGVGRRVDFLGTAAWCCNLCLIPSTSSPSDIKVTLIALDKLETAVAHIESHSELRARRERAQKETNNSKSAYKTSTQSHTSRAIKGEKRESANERKKIFGGLGYGISKHTAKRPNEKPEYKKPKPPPPSPRATTESLSDPDDDKPLINRFRPGPSRLRGTPNSLRRNIGLPINPRKPSILRPPTNPIRPPNPTISLISDTELSPNDGDSSDSDECRAREIRHRLEQYKARVSKAWGENWKDVVVPGNHDVAASPVLGFASRLALIAELIPRKYLAWVRAAVAEALRRKRGKYMAVEYLTGGDMEKVESWWLDDEKRDEVWSVVAGRSA